jgi:hypothetical protein
MAAANLSIPNDFNVYADVYKGSENSGLYYEAHHTNNTGKLVSTPNGFLGNILESGITTTLSFTNKRYGGSNFFFTKFVGWIKTPQAVSEDFTFYLSADDFANLYIDGQKVVYAYYQSGAQTGIYNLIANHWHSIYIEWGQMGGASTMMVDWESATIPLSEIPVTCLKNNQICQNVTSANMCCGATQITETLESTSSTTGVLTVSGGVGISKDLYVGGTIHGSVISMGPPSTVFIQAYPDPVLSVSADSDPLHYGHFRINPIPEPTLEYDRQFHITNTAESTDTQTGSLMLDGGLGIAKNVNIGGNIVIDGSITCPSMVYENVQIVEATTDSSSTSTGSLIVAGGGGIAKTLFVGTGINSDNGILRGKLINGNVWYRIYNIGILKNDSLSMNVITKNNLHDDISVQTYNIGGSIGTITIGTPEYEITGNATYASRICNFTPYVEYLEIDNSTAGGNGNIGDNYYQTFKSVTGNKLTGFAAYLSDTGNSIYEVRICHGIYNAGAILATSNQQNVYTWQSYKFDFPQALQLTAGETYSATFIQVSGGGQRWIQTNGTYADGALYDMSNNPVGGSLVFLCYTATETIESDIFIFATNNPSSLTQVEINHCGGAPLWTNEGSGSWPSSLPASKILTFDTSVNLSNTDKQIGSIIVNTATESTNSQTGSIINAGGLGVVKRANIGGILKTWDTTQSTDTSTGSLITLGGLGVAKDAYIGGTLNANTLNMTSTIESTDTNTGSFIVDGGLGVVKRANIGGILKTWDTTQSTDTSTGSLITLGGLGVAKDVYIGGSLNTPTLSMTSTTQSTSTSTGALITAGGLGVAKNLNVGGTIKQLDTTQSTSTSTGSLIVSGGLGIAKDVQVSNAVSWPSFKITHNQAGSTDFCTMAGLTAGATLMYFTLKPLTQTVANKGVISADSTGKMTLHTEGSAPIIEIDTTTQSTDTNTGSLRILGGMGIAKNANIGGILKSQDTTQATSITSGSLVTAGGLGVAKDAYIGGTCYINSLNNPQLTLQNPAFGETFNVSVGTGGGITFNNAGVSDMTLNMATHLKLQIDNTIDSSNISTGSFIDSGGVGIAKKLNIGGITKTWDTTQATSITSGSLICAGGLGVSKDAYIGGTCYINSLNNPQLTLQNPAFGETFNVSVGTGGGITFNNAGVSDMTLNLAHNLKLQIDNTIDSSNISTGSFIDSGGVGIAKNLNIGGITKVWNTTNSTDTLTGALEVVGGAGIGGNLYVGGTIYGSLNGNSMQTASYTCIGTAESTSISTGSMVLSGGMGVASSLNIGGMCQVNITTESTSTSTGALISHGGCGIAKNTNIGGLLKVYDTSATTSTSTGCLSIAGGIGISKGFYLAGRTIYGSQSVDITGAGPFNDLVIPSSSIVYLTGTITNNVHITGFSSTGVIDGQQFRLIGYYGSNVTVIIDHDSASSAAANRIYTNTGSNVNMSLNPISATLYIYNASLSRWLMICVDP